jgi:hypothetical protein
MSHTPNISQGMDLVWRERTCREKGWHLKTECVVEEDNFSYFILVSKAKVKVMI